ncbi:MAG: glycosyltransferase family 4 protein [Candidatus Binataceae bacterium]
MARALMIAYTTYFHDGRVKRHAEALALRGDHIDVICLGSELTGEANGVNVIGLKMPRYRGASRTAYLRSYLRFFAMASATAARLSLAHRYDVVIVCTMPDAAVLCALGPKLLGSKVVLDVHDTMPELYQDKFGGRRGAAGARLLMAEERASAWLADRVLAVHDLHRERLERAGIPRGKIKVVMNLPDPRIFTPSRNGKTHDDKFTIICHGTLTRRLGLDIAIRAVYLVRDRIPGLRLLVVGGGDYLDEAKRLALGLALDDTVVFEPPVAIERLPAILADADLGLVPNRATSATHLMLPVKLLEYATLGIPVAAARLHTISHYFSENAVRFFRPEDPSDMAGAIEELYRHPEQRAALAAAARAIADRLNWPSQRKEYFDAIDSLIGDAPA